MRVGSVLGILAIGVTIWPVPVWAGSYQEYDFGSMAHPAMGIRVSPTAEPVDIGELWRRAGVRMDTSDYDEAVELLTRLYDVIATDPEADALRLRVRWTLHRAHMGAFGVDQDPAHLYVARDLLTRYLEDLPETEGERRTDAEGSLEQVQAQIAIHEADLEAARAAKVAAAQVEARARQLAEAEAAATARRQAEAARRAAESTVQPAVDETAGRPLIIAGGVSLGVGVAGMGTMLGGLVAARAAVEVFETDPQARDEARSDIQRNNTVGIAGGVVGGVLLVTGATLLALGLRQRSRAMSVAPGPGQVGMSVQLRF